MSYIQIAMRNSISVHFVILCSKMELELTKGSKFSTLFLITLSIKLNKRSVTVLVRLNYELFFLSYFFNEILM